MTKQARLLTAVLLCCALLVPTSATAAATTSVSPNAETSMTEATAKAKVHAQLLDEKVKVNARARIRGNLELDVPSYQRGLEIVVVQKFVAGAWIDVGSTSCRANGSFRLIVSFSVAAQYTLRVYHPPTTAASSVLSLSVVF